MYGEDGWAVVDGLGGWLDFFQRLVGVDAGGGCSARRAGMERRRCLMLDGMILFLWDIVDDGPTFRLFDLCLCHFCFVAVGELVMLRKRFLKMRCPSIWKSAVLRNFGGVQISCRRALLSHHSQPSTAEEWSGC